jgi:hypothetical protein
LDEEIVSLEERPVSRAGDRDAGKAKGSGSGVSATAPWYHGQIAGTEMLEEIPNPRQYPDEPRRRWFRSATFDLYVWVGEGDSIVGFQLCYRMGPVERALTWKEESGFSHAAVDDGEGDPGHFKAIPILVKDGAFPGSEVAGQFVSECAEIDPDVVRFVESKIRNHT